jgi:hypothetical protein
MYVICFTSDHAYDSIAVYLKDKLRSCPKPDSSNQNGIIHLHRIYVPLAGLLLEYTFFILRIMPMTFETLVMVFSIWSFHAFHL